MPLFYFHIVAAEITLLDEDGVRFASRAAALTHARDLMSELARSLQRPNGAIIVENDDDGELFEVPLSGAPE